jgi:hypothetical protein
MSFPLLSQYFYLGFLVSFLPWVIPLLFHSLPSSTSLLSLLGRLLHYFFFTFTFHSSFIFACSVHSFIFHAFVFNIISSDSVYLFQLLFHSTFQFSTSLLVPLLTFFPSRFFTYFPKFPCVFFLSFFLFTFKRRNTPFVLGISLQLNKLWRQSH